MTRSQQAAAIFYERTGVKPDRARAGAGSMRDFVSLGLSTMRDTDFTRVDYGYAFQGVRARFLSTACPWKHEPGVTLNIEWAELGL